ncbi:WD40 repeat-like protein [Polyporus arcularius HHB13444]|uniref:WD40 repeat-like protein n=1 Tax=Polyporus arcularius HHB13444 TaxID=1314778 RepID=A0A5C3P081_9APHY|nr:WD40 repeat-like protein [Polyporus arcularius HHB13444]
MNDTFSGQSDGKVHLGHDKNVTAMAASPDGRYVATGAGDDTVILWTAYETHRLDFGHPHSLASCASFVGDTQFVMGFHDGTIRWWDTSSTPLTTAQPRGILSFCPKGSTSVYVLRRTNTRTVQGQLGGDFSLHVILRGHTKGVTNVCFSPCERYIAASINCTVQVWNTRDGELLKTFCDHDSHVMHIVFASDGRNLVSADVHGRVRTRSLC